jgi:hypothetical protein
MATLSRIKAGNVSRLLKRSGHTTVFPDRRREGMSVRQAGSDTAVSVQLSYDTPHPDMPDVVDEVLSTLHKGGYTTRVSHQDEYSANIWVTRPLDDEA